MKSDIKEQILSLFETPEKHPTAQELYSKLQKLDKSISEEAFTRELRKLLTRKALYSVTSIENTVHYGRKKGHHGHFICTSCGKVRDFFVEEGATNMINDHIQKIIHSFGRVTKTNISTEGLCHECQKRQK